MESSPRGPFTWTVDMACILPSLAFIDGGIILNVTPGGIERGEEPIFDLHVRVVVKLLEGAN
jgi:hypothetical protein